MTHLRWKNFLLPALYYAAILSVSLIPRSGVDKVGDFLPLPNDKLLHLAVYTGFGFVLGGLPYPSLALGTAGSLLGAADEQIQRLAPGRDVSFADWLADVLGVSLGLAWRRRPRG
jgi:VanZ family protein